MQSETGFPSSHQLKSYVASKSRLKLAARAVLSADAGLLVLFGTMLKVESLEKRLGLGLARSRSRSRIVTKIRGLRLASLVELHLRSRLHF